MDLASLVEQESVWIIKSKNFLSMFLLKFPMSNLHAFCNTEGEICSHSLKSAEPLGMPNTRDTPDEFEVPWDNDPDWYCSPEDLDEGDCF